MHTYRIGGTWVDNSNRERVYDISALHLAMAILPWPCQHSHLSTGQIAMRISLWDNLPYPPHLPSQEVAIDHSVTMGCIFGSRSSLPWVWLVGQVGAWLLHMTVCGVTITVHIRGMSHLLGRSSARAVFSPYLFPVGP